MAFCLGSKLLRSDREICTFSTIGPAFASLLIDTTPVSLSNIRHDTMLEFKPAIRRGVCMPSALPYSAGEGRRRRKES